MPATTLKEARKKHSRDAVKVMETYNSTDKETFSEIIKTAVSLGISQSEIAKLFDVNSSTISRWKKGQSLPLKIIRKQVVKDIASLIKHKEELADNA